MSQRMTQIDCRVAAQPGSGPESHVPHYFGHDHRPGLAIDAKAKVVATRIERSQRK
jgi:hypothetical protein